MNAPSRMPLVLAFLIGMFVAATGLAVAVLASFSDPMVLAVAGIAGAACIVAGLITWLILRGVRQEPYELAGLEDDALPVRHAPARIHALPSGELPPAYLAAVMKGIAANRAAMRSRDLHH
ncbi:MAG TPA: hypothetical protein VF522_23110 [Ramlibacter sp.]|uniref:hypothetical protein n=1 Tax=Ramlibacter sp. TaxID=1917967 RepID=UPI002ED3BFCB